MVETVFGNGMIALSLGPRLLLVYTSLHTWYTVQSHPLTVTSSQPIPHQRSFEDKFTPCCCFPYLNKYIEQCLVVREQSS